MRGPVAGGRQIARGRSASARIVRRGTVLATDCALIRRRGMKKFLFVVYGPPAENEEERAGGMALMAEWCRSLGPALVDPGAPFVAARTVADTGVGDAIGPSATGYNMVEAESLDEAIGLAQMCPLLQHGRKV